MDNIELENEIELRMNPEDFSLSTSDLLDIMNQYGLSEHDVAFAYSEIVARKRTELTDTSKDVIDMFREKGNHYPSFNEFKKMFNQYDRNTYIDDNILRDMHKKEIQDTNQTSMFEIREMIKEQFRAMSEDDDFDREAAAITKNWGGEIKKSPDAMLSTSDFEDIVDAGSIARGEIELEFGDDEFVPMSDDEYKTIMNDLSEDLEVEQKGLFRPQDSQGNDIKLKSLVSNLEGTKKGRVIGFGDDGAGNMIARVEWVWPMDMKFTAPEEMGMKPEPIANLVVQGMNESSGEEGRSKLRGVRVTYADGTVIPTSMAAHLSDEDIYKYFSKGSLFNIGSVEDNMQAVDSVEIIRENVFDEGKSYSFDKKSLYHWFQDAIYQLKDLDEAEAAMEMEKAFNKDYEYELKINEIREMKEELKENEEILKADSMLSQAIMQFHNAGGTKEAAQRHLDNVFQGNERAEYVDTMQAKYPDMYQDGIEEARGLGHAVKNNGDRNVKKSKDNSHAPVTTLPEGTLNSKIKTLSEGSIKKKELLNFIKEEANNFAKDIKGGNKN
jgi:hypothetical protein